MATVKIPYNRTALELHIDDRNLHAVIEDRSRCCDPGKTGDALVREALASPSGTKRLRELAAAARSVTVVTSDHTRALPSRITLPAILEEIRRGNPDADITILIATGLHRPTTRDEMRSMFGDVIVDSEKIAVNMAFEPDGFVSLGRLPSGAELVVNRLAAGCDLLVAEGLIEPHFFAGFSGGSKSILPGVCSEETVNENHSYKALSSPDAATGVIEGNPVREDIEAAGRMANLGFILNVVLSGDRRIIGAFAGHRESAHREGAGFLRSLSECPAVEGDIIVTSNGGYPLDQNLYQSAKGASTAEACAAEGAVIILCASCCDGIGGDNFAGLMTSGSADDIDARLRDIPPKKTRAESWNAQIFSRILKKHRIILVSDLDPDEVRKFNMTPAPTPDEALRIAYSLKGPKARVVAIPDGVAAIVAKVRRPE